MYRRRKRSLEKEQENEIPQKKPRIALYFEDNTPVRTIEVTNIADNYVCSKYLQGHFEHAGPITNVTILKKLQGSEEIPVAYVTFLIPEDAADVIFDVNSLYKKFTVKEADRTHQPEIDPNILNLQDVNDHCLLHISSYLDLVDIASLGLASTRLQSFARLIYEKKTHFSFGLDTGDPKINEKNLPIILQGMGAHIQSIEWKDLNSTHLDYLAEYCPIVTSIKLDTPRNDLHSISVKRNKKFFANVKTLDIRNAPFYDLTWKMITFSTKLKSLRIESCKNFSGKFLSKWRSPKLKCLEIIDGRMVDIECIFRFVQNHQLVTFSFDGPGSFVHCLSTPSQCLKNLKKLNLDASHLTDAELALLKFEDLEKLTDLTVTHQYVYGVTKCNNLLAAISRVNTLTSLRIGHFVIDGDTIKHFGSLENLQEMYFMDYRNTIGEELYSSIPVHLPKLTKLVMRSWSTDAIDHNVICGMISSLKNLKYFSHSSMTWITLDMILKVQLGREESTIEIGLTNLFLDDPRKIAFEVASKGTVTLSALP